MPLSGMRTVSSDIEVFAQPVIRTIGAQTLWVSKREGLKPVWQGFHSRLKNNK